MLDERDPNIIASSGADGAIRVFIENKDKEVSENLLYPSYRLVLQVLMLRIMLIP